MSGFKLKECQYMKRKLTNSTINVNLDIFFIIGIQNFTEFSIIIKLRNFVFKNIQFKSVLLL